MISVESKGNFNNLERFLNRALRQDIFNDLDRYGQMGVNALAAATPVDSGLTAHSWKFKVIKDRRHPGISWYNTNVVNGTPVAILIQYGHATGTGGYVQGIDYINPAMRSLFDQIAQDIWKKVTA